MPARIAASLSQNGEEEVQPSSSSTSPAAVATAPSQLWPTFEIKPPLTTGDKGQSSPDILHDAERVLAFITDERHLVAHSLYLDVQRRLDEWQQQQQQQSASTSPHHGKRHHYAPPHHRHPHNSHNKKGGGAGGGGGGGGRHEPRHWPHPHLRQHHHTTATSHDHDERHAKAQALLDSKRSVIETLEVSFRL